MSHYRHAHNKVTQTKVQSFLCHNLFRFSIFSHSTKRWK